uniref:Phosphoenolpyruvate carboxykinase C-terminal P-loop domain-containing protein n=1 Tax=Ditylenchus dipsaci TaxID=166011 RepID=A0A915DF45_9BILA
MSWSHGVFMAASLRSENCMKTLQHDPMGIRSAMAYNFAHYIQHWLNMETAQRRMPRIFFSNLYRRDVESDQLLWPGFGENIRIFDWITRRLSDVQDGSSMQMNEFVDSPLGKLANKGDFNLEGLDHLDWQQLMSVTNEFWSSEYNSTKEFFFKEMGNEVPQKMLDELESMRRRLNVENNNNNKS